MPLVQSSSKEAIQENTKREIEAGKKPDQAYAIANSVARQNVHDSMNPHLCGAQGTKK